MRAFETEDALCERTEVDPDGLIAAVERAVGQAACGQVGGLTVDRLGDAVVVQGHCRTYHASQLAREAILDLLGDRARLIDLILVR